MRAPLSTKGWALCMWCVCVLKALGESNGSLRLQVIFAPINHNNLIKSREVCVSVWGFSIHLCKCVHASVSADLNFSNTFNLIWSFSCRLQGWYFTHASQRNLTFFTWISQTSAMNQRQMAFAHFKVHSYEMLIRDPESFLYAGPTWAKLFRETL